MTAPSSRLSVALLLALCFGSGCESRKVDGTPHFLHCPECKIEMSYTTQLEGKPCPHCGAEHRLVATHKSIFAGGDEEKDGVWGTVVAVSLIVAVIVQSGILLWVWRRRLTQKQKNEMVLHSACPLCRRKISYPARMIGKGAQCSRCKTAYLLPAAEGVPADEQAI